MCCFHGKEKETRAKTSFCMEFQGRKQSNGADFWGLVAPKYLSRLVLLTLSGRAGFLV